MNVTSEFPSLAVSTSKKQVLMVHVAIPLPVEDPFTYSVPDELTAKVKVGVRVNVPFKNRNIVGYVVGSEQNYPTPKTKPISEVLDDEPVISEHFLALSRWMKDYYFSSWGEAIQNMVPKHLRQKKISERKKKSRVENQEDETKKIIELNPEQEIALQKIHALLERGKYEQALLFGVTGSGKSELYIRAINKTLLMGKSAICLVPEIALTEQIKHFFRGHFGNQLEIIHSKLSDGERWEAWNRIKTGEKTVVLGARSAIFAPFEKLGLIIIDEEQEMSYKQDKTPRYHARDVARWRAQALHALLLLGSATPSVETMHEANEKRMVRLDLTKRVAEQKLPSINIVDLKLFQDIAKTKVIISQRLEEAIRLALEKKHGILLLLNRRGFSTMVQCFKCAQPVMCRYCDVALTFHQENHKFICHYCNYQMEETSVCSKCGNSLFRFAGIGTEKVESEVARLFPSARIARMDSDSIRRKGSHEKILNQFRSRELDILVGTQMIAKGFDFPHVTLVGVVLADTALLLPDFRSSEKTFQLLTQVAGRSGRGIHEGRVFVQTFQPYHYSIRMACTHDALNFYEKELQFRREYSYPPFSKLVNIILRGKIEKNVMEQALALQKKLAGDISSKTAQVIGPAPLPFRKLRGNFRWHIMLKCALNIESVSQLLKTSFESFGRTAKVQIAVDVDPMSIL